MENFQLATSNFIFNISYLCKNKSNHYVIVLSIFQFIWRDLALAIKYFNRRKKYVLIIGIWWMNVNHLRMCSAKIDILLNSCVTEYQTNCMIKISEKYQWESSILVKWRGSITCNFSKNGTLSQAYFNWFSSDLEKLFCRRSLSGCFLMSYSIFCSIEWSKKDVKYTQWNNKIT